MQPVQLAQMATKTPPAFEWVKRIAQGEKGMERRNFIRLGLLSSVAGLIVPAALVRAQSESPLAGSVYFTKDSPGRWREKAEGHLPQLALDSSTGILQVTTGHEMKGYEHYIIRHILLDEDYQFINEKMFDPMTDPAPISRFEIKDYRGTLHALSVCNQHGTWLNSIEV